MSKEFLNIYNEICKDVNNGEHVDGNWVKAKFDLNGYALLKHDRISNLEAALTLAKEITQSDRDEPCRYDHNRNCQNHSWFGLDGEDCPVDQFRQALKKI